MGSVWLGPSPLILASQSAVRKSLLVNAGIAVETIPASIDERAVQATSGVTHPSGIAKLLAEAKARDVAKANPARIVIGADQTLALGTRLFNKPKDRASAAAQIAALAGQTHELHSAVSVVRDGRLLFSHVAVARMTMRPLAELEIAAYLDAAGEAVTTSVGAYQLESVGVNLFDKIDGDHFTILGLPLLPLLAFLRSEKLLSV